jgi:hypothetical protein
LLRELLLSLPTRGRDGKKERLDIWFEDMKWGTNRSWPIPKRPGRLVIITFLVLSALFGITALFIPDIQSTICLFAGVGYSAFLAVLSVGICLRGPNAAKQLKVIMLLGLLIILATYLPIVYGMFTQDYSTALTVLDTANRIALWLLLGMLAFMFILAALGWKQHFQKKETKE